MNQTCKPKNIFGGSSFGFVFNKIPFVASGRFVVRWVGKYNTASRVRLCDNTCNSLQLTLKNLFFLNPRSRQISRLLQMVIRLCNLITNQGIILMYILRFVIRIVLLVRCDRSSCKICNLCRYSLFFRTSNRTLPWEDHGQLRLSYKSTVHSLLTDSANKQMPGKFIPEKIKFWIKSTIVVDSWRN